MWVSEVGRSDHGVSSHNYCLALLTRRQRTCFWAGDTFAPKLRVKSKDSKEMSVQQFLQNAFLDMWETVARTVGDLDGVIGFEVRECVLTRTLHADLSSDS